MYPLLPFAVGLLTGAVGIRLLKAGKTRATLDKAQERLRDATVSSLNAIEHSSAQLRARLAAEPASDAAPPALTAAVEEAAPPRRRRAAPKGEAVTKAAAAETAKPKARVRRPRKATAGEAEAAGRTQGDSAAEAKS